MAFDVRITSAAERAIDKLSKGVQAALVARLDELAVNPRPHDAEKLKAMPKQYKVYRVPLRTSESSFRIVYQVKDSELWLLVLKVADRREVYERVSDLKRLLR